MLDLRHPSVPSPSIIPSPLLSLILYSVVIATSIPSSTSSLPLIRLFPSLGFSRTVLHPSIQPSLQLIGTPFVRAIPGPQVLPLHHLRASNVVSSLDQLLSLEDASSPTRSNIGKEARHSGPIVEGLPLTGCLNEKSCWIFCKLDLANSVIISHGSAPRARCG